MNHCAVMQNVFSAHEEMRSSVPIPISDFRDHLVCPKPRRFSPFKFSHPPDASLRWNLSHQPDQFDRTAGTDLLDFLLTRGGCSMEQSPLASSPPFSCESPPSRVANPLIQDARFVEEKIIPWSPPIASPSGQSSPSSTTTAWKGGGRVRASYGNKPMVRIEGFDCLDRDRQNCSIPAFA